MLRIAVPNKGSLSEPASAMLQEAGYRQRKDRRELVLVDSDNDVEFFFLRPRDIALYVGSGRLDIGITGRDLLLDSGADAEEILQLGFAGSTFRYATRPGTAKDVSEFGGMTVATSFAGLVTKHLADHGIDASVVRLDGAVETAIQLGVAEVIADVVETGTTLRNAGLEIIGEPILESEAIVILPRTPSPAAPGETSGNGVGIDDPKVQQFLRRMQGVLVARRYVMMDYDIRVEQVEKAIAVTPGLESPTVSPLHNEGWVAVRAMVPSKDAQRIMDDLYDLGARAILTTGIHACRL
ncbi:ATP phosphoribosyltransferase [Streptomyces sp. KR80]|uniref:ATP phosphoribosyltransferase n=1 Tax=Streptomyces sp. KR80 TaxID=3457426 RepID=UPI003FD32EFA